MVARTALVRRLRAEKRREEAAEVAKRRRPSPAAWALDRVAVEQADLVEQALAAGARLRTASEAAMAGDAAGLRRATTEDRAASDAVVDAALRHLGARGAAARPRLRPRCERPSSTTRSPPSFGAACWPPTRRRPASAGRASSKRPSRRRHHSPATGRSGSEKGPGADPQRGARQAEADTEADDAGTGARTGAGAEGASGDSPSPGPGRGRRRAGAGSGAATGARRDRAPGPGRGRAGRPRGGCRRLARAAEQAEAEALRARAEADQADEAARAARDELRRAAAN